MAQRSTGLLSWIGDPEAVVQVSNALARLGSSIVAIIGLLMFMFFLGQQGLAIADRQLTKNAELAERRLNHFEALIKQEQMETGQLRDIVAELEHIARQCYIVRHGIND